MRYFVTVIPNKPSNIDKEKETYTLLVDDSNEDIVCKVFNESDDKIADFTSHIYADAKQAGLDFINFNFGVVTNIEEQEFDNP